MDPQFPPATPSPTWPPPAYPSVSTALPSQARRGIAAALIGVVVVGLAAVGVAAFLFLRGSGDVLAKVTPANSAMYVSVYLDPSGTEKLNANSLLGKFPNGATQESRDKVVNEFLDSALTKSGLTHTDIRAWLGSQVGIALAGDALNNLKGSPASGSSGGLSSAAATAVPDLAFMVVSKDDTAAGATLDRLRTVNSSGTWSTEQLDGVTINYSSAAGAPVYTLVNHVVVIGTTRAYVEAVVNTAHGKTASISSDANYKATLAQLPADRLALGYLSGDSLRGLMAQTSNPGSSDALQTLTAIRGVGLEIGAASDGLQMDFTVAFDPATMSASQRASLQAVAHVNSVIGFTAANAYGFLAVVEVQNSLKAVVSQLSLLSPAAADTAHKLGLDSATGIISRLSGDAGVAVGPDPQTSGGTGGALLVGTNDDSAMQSYLDGLPSTLGCTNSLGSPCATTTTSYRSTTITSIRISASNSASWTVYQHMAIIGTSVAAVQAAIDAKAGNNGITATSRYKEALGHTDASNAGILYVDVAAVAAAVRDTLSTTAQADYDKNTAPYVRPFSSAIFTVTNGSDHVNLRIFVTIK